MVGKSGKLDLLDYFKRHMHLYFANNIIIETDFKDTGRECSSRWTNEPGKICSRTTSLLENWLMLRPLWRFLLDIHSRDPSIGGDREKIDSEIDSNK